MLMLPFYRVRLFNSAPVITSSGTSTAECQRFHWTFIITTLQRSARTSRSVFCYYFGRPFIHPCSCCIIDICFLKST
eukprot:UN17475